MSHPMTFGVELKFLVAMVFPGDSDPNPDDPRTVKFEPTTAEIQQITAGYFEKRSGDEFSDELYAAIEHDAHQPAVIRTISQSLKDAGHRVEFATARINESGVMPTSWEVVRSVQAEMDEEKIFQYSWEPVEVRSPALDLSTESLDQVRDVCRLLMDTYICGLNETAGLHIHIGFGDEGFDLATVRALLAFTWAFEPQFDTLHPPEKLQDPSSASMRNESYMTNMWYAEHGERMTPLQGVLEIWGHNTNVLGSIVNAFSPFYTPDPKNQNVSFCGLCCRRMPPEYRICTARPTIEFRQHKATLDGEEVTMWIETVAGVVQFVKDADVTDLLCLFELLKHEKWEKLGDGKDGEREKAMGRIVADYGFTIIDLLRHIGLEKQAAYYESWWHPHERPPFIPKGEVEVRPGHSVPVGELPPRLTRWKYLEQPEEFSEEQLETADAARLLWEQMSRITEIYTSHGFPDLVPPRFDPDDQALWPEHQSSIEVNAPLAVEATGNVPGELAL